MPGRLGVVAARPACAPASACAGRADPDPITQLGKAKAVAFDAGQCWLPVELASIDHGEAVHL
jgi:hypothetical protein